MRRSPSSDSDNHRCAHRGAHTCPSALTLSPAPSLHSGASCRSGQRQHPLTFTIASTLALSFAAAFSHSGSCARPGPGACSGAGFAAAVALTHTGAAALPPDHMQWLRFCGCPQPIGWSRPWGRLLKELLWKDLLMCYPCLGTSARTLQCFLIVV